ncbi:MAG: DUF1772 domain-containing protein [Novosphingobium sp.]
MIAGLIGLTLAAAFAGAAIYINAAEHPARMGLPLDQAVRQWRPSYARGFRMQGGLAVASGLAALAQWYLSGGLLWLAGGLLMLANWPFTLLVIMPINHRLEADGADRNAESSDLLARWNQLHAVRSGLGLTATVVLLAAAACTLP